MSRYIGQTLFIGYTESNWRAYAAYGRSKLTDDLVNDPIYGVGFAAHLFYGKEYVLGYERLLPNHRNIKVRIEAHANEGFLFGPYSANNNTREGIDRYWGFMTAGLVLGF